MTQDVFRRLLLLEGQAVSYSDANLNDPLLNSKWIPLKCVLSHLNPFHILTSSCSRILLMPSPPSPDPQYWKFYWAGSGTFITQKYMF